MATAIAKEKGFWGRLLEPGERFEVPDGTKEGRWFIIEDAPEKPAAKGKRGEKPDAGHGDVI